MKIISSLFEILHHSHVTASLFLYISFSNRSNSYFSLKNKKYKNNLVLAAVVFSLALSKSLPPLILCNKAEFGNTTNFLSAKKRWMCGSWVLEKHPEKWKMSFTHSHTSLCSCKTKPPSHFKLKTSHHAIKQIKSMPHYAHHLLSLSLYVNKCFFFSTLPIYVICILLLMKMWRKWLGPKQRLCGQECN